VAQCPFASVRYWEWDCLANEDDATLHRPAIFVAIFLNEFHCSGVISFEAIGVEVDAKFPEMS
jgi:hypothetical protein